jgi:5'-deoxynucleotidase YfbR-like HD superfamily hydrolase
VIVSELVQERGGDTEDVFAGLMHDAAEAYLGDMPHPLKHRSALGAAFRQAEEHLEEAIRARFGIRADVPEVKRAERWHWPELDGVEALDLELTAWPPEQATKAFLERYAQLEAQR